MSKNANQKAVIFVGRVLPPGKNKHDKDIHDNYTLREMLDINLVGIPVMIEHDVSSSCGIILSQAIADDKSMFVLGCVPYNGGKNDKRRKDIMNGELGELSLGHLHNRTIKDGDFDVHTKQMREISLCKEARRPRCDICIKKEIDLSDSEFELTKLWKEFFRKIKTGRLLKGCAVSRNIVQASALFKSTNMDSQDNSVQSNNSNYSTSNNSGSANTNSYQNEVVSKGYNNNNGNNNSGHNDGGSTSGNGFNSNNHSIRQSDRENNINNNNSSITPSHYQDENLNGKKRYRQDDNNTNNDGNDNNINNDGIKIKEPITKRTKLDENVERSRVSDEHDDDIATPEESLEFVRMARDRVKQMELLNQQLSQEMKKYQEQNQSLQKELKDQKNRSDFTNRLFMNSVEEGLNVLSDEDRVGDMERKVIHNILTGCRAQTDEEYQALSNGITKMCSGLINASKKNSKELKEYEARMYQSMGNGMNNRPSINRQQFFNTMQDMGIRGTSNSWGVSSISTPINANASGNSKVNEPLRYNNNNNYNNNYRQITEQTHTSQSHTPSRQSLKQCASKLGDMIGKCRSINSQLDD